MRINLSDGRTLIYHLATKASERAWRSFESDPTRQNQIRGAVLNTIGGQVSISTPKKFETVSFSADMVTAPGHQIIGEKISIQADNVRLSVLLYQSGFARVDLVKTGTPRYLPQYYRRNGNGR